VPRPIVFIHGAFGSGSDFAAWADFFGRAGFACHAPSLPGHEPPDASRLRTLRIADYVASVQELIQRLPDAPVIVGHSMGGLVAQHLGALVPCRALVCVASAPTSVLMPQRIAWPYLLPLLPDIVRGRPFRAPPEAVRALALHDLPPEEAEVLSVRGYESGKAYRELIFGLSRVRTQAIACPVLCASGTLDRIIPQNLSDRLAHAYGAEHLRFARGHWLIAPSALGDVAVAVLRWLESTLDHDG
jgi:pimeloyl-ACP methyl ester carboxylesterase